MRPMRAHWPADLYWLGFRPGTESLRKLLCRPIPYAVSASVPETGALAVNLPDIQSGSSWQEHRRYRSSVAGLTAVDGAVALTDRYDCSSLVSKIARREGLPAGEQGQTDGADCRGTGRGCPIRSTSVHQQSFAAQFIQDHGAWRWWASRTGRCHGL